MSAATPPNSLQSASIDWSDPAAPVSIVFDDVYFSKDNGAAETELVFLRNSQLPERFAQHPRRHFTVAETGFGTGLNLLVLWDKFNAYLRDNPDSPCQRLHFVSFEKYPLNVDELSRAHQQWPQFAALSAQLREYYPTATAGCHRLVLQNGQLILDLWFGDAIEQLPTLDAGHNGVIDAWFLDGFTPSRNPDMWQPALYTQMARLSRPNATFATFTAASSVRRGLMEVGFEVQKTPGFGLKREMMHGVLVKPDVDEAQPAQEVAVREVAVVGAGLAGAMSALSLVRRGVKVTLYCADDAPAQSASGNRQGAIYPLLNQGNDGLSQFYQQAFPLARQALKQIVALGHEIHHDLGGVLQLPIDDKTQKRIDALSQQPFPTDVVHGVDPEQGSQIAGIPLTRNGLHYPLGGWLCPAQLTRAILAEADKTGLLQCHYQHTLTALTQHSEHWQLDFADRASQSSPHVVLAMGHRSVELTQTAHLPLNPVRGQISYPQVGSHTVQLKVVLCADGYLVPQQDGRLTCGASFGRGDASSEWRASDKTEIAQRMHNSFGQESWHHELVLDDSGRAAVRAAVRDHLPLVGPVPDWQCLRQWQAGDALHYQQGLYLISGLGSRGLCSAALCAELLTSQLCDESRPQSVTQQDNLAPNRFWLRKRKKGQSVS